MKRKELLLAVIGGVVGALLTMAAGSIAPLGAQNDVRDVEFGAITCKSIRVKPDEPGATGVLIHVGEDGVGEIIVPGKKGGLLGIMGSTILIQSGEIRVMDKQANANVVIQGHKSVSIGIVRDEKHQVLIGNNEHGGAVLVQSVDRSGSASMGIFHGDGIVTARDKDGNHSWASRGK